MNKTSESTPASERPMTYLALGDSYTLGESVLEKDRWPVQLTTKLKSAGVSLEDPKIVATTGWTTSELQTGISQASLEENYDLVSLLIGVNNQYRGNDIEIYRKEFEELLDQAIGFAGNKPDNVFVVSIPDYGVTPFASNANLNPQKIATELDNYNSISEEICMKRGVKFIEITEWSRKAKNDPSLITSDGLHPSGKMYENWVNTCFDWVQANLESR